MTEEGLKVDIDWIAGRGSYLVGALVLLTYLKIDLDDKHWLEIEPLYKDGDNTNVCLQNLTYRFKNGPLEAEGYPGFYHVPFFSRYAINKDGTMINVHTGKEKSWYVSAGNPERNCLGGYNSTRVVNHHGNSTGIFQHRALCLTFKPYGANVDEMVVNHKDGDKSNNDLDNLEWTTHLENNLHAIQTGLKGATLKPVLMLNRLTGEVQRFNSLVECLEKIGKQHLSYIYHRLVSTRSGVRVKDSVLFKYDDGTAWPETDMRLTYQNANGIKATATNVSTGEVVEFAGAGAGQKLTGVKRATILFNLKKGREVPVGGWVFRKSVQLLH